MAEETDKAGLTLTERNIIKNCWDEVKKNIHDNGHKLFFRFFSENSSYQSLFKAFKDVPLSDLKNNKKWLAHAMNVMYALSMLVDNIDDTDVLIEMLDKLAKNHARRKISVQMFENLKITLVGTLKEVLGLDLMNETATDAWKKTFDVIVAVVKPELENASEDD